MFYFLKVRLKCVRLRRVPREPIEDEALAGVVARQPGAQQLEHDLIRHQLAVVHVALRALADVGFPLDREAKEVTRCDVRDFEALGKPNRLRPLPRPRRPQQDEPHAGYFRKPS